MNEFSDSKHDIPMRGAFNRDSPVGSREKAIIRNLEPDFFYCLKFKLFLNLLLKYWNFYFKNQKLLKEMGTTQFLENYYLKTKSLS